MGDQELRTTPKRKTREQTIDTNVLQRLLA